MLTPRSVDPRVVIREQILRQIIQLDKSRIFSRLRSKHAAKSRKTAGRPALTDLLSRTLGDPSIRGTKIVKSSFERARSQSEHLSETFAKLEAIRDSHEDSTLLLSILANLLYQIYEFDVDYLRKALHISSTIDPTLKTFLPEAMKKLGRYYGIANELVDAARKPSYTIFRHVAIEVLETPKINSISVTGSVQGFEAALQRNMALRQDDRERHSRSLTEARTKYQSRIWNCATPWKIHAEIQLLFFYEQNLSIRHPRAICSSKSACYLCDLFIKIHGEFHTPRTHGRLYDKWILPERAIDQLSADQRILSVLIRFNIALEAKIAQTLENMHHVYPHPTESILQVAEPWSSTSTLPRAASELNDPGLPDGSPYDVPKESAGCPASILHLSAESITEITPKSTVFTSQARNLDLGHGTYLNSDDTGKVSSPDLDNILRTLSYGDVLHQKLGSATSGLIVRTKVLDLHISWQRDPIDHDPSNIEVKDGRWIRVEWLGSESCRAAGDDLASSIDVDMLASGEEKVVESENASDLGALAIRNGKHALLLQWYDEITLSKRDPSCIEHDAL